MLSRNHTTIGEKNVIAFDFPLCTFPSNLLLGLTVWIGIHSHWHWMVPSQTATSEVDEVYAQLCFGSISNLSRAVLAVFVPWWTENVVRVCSESWTRWTPSYEYTTTTITTYNVRITNAKSDDRSSGSGSGGSDKEEDPQEAEGKYIVQNGIRGAIGKS